MINLHSAKRTFTLGDTWLYYKIYTGHKTADSILTEAIKPLSKVLLEKEIIDQWFFIRYSDPKFHIRIRFRLHDQENLGTLMLRLNESLRPWIEQDYIWKVEAEDYSREIERYDPNAMEEAESIFHIDSSFIVDFLDLIEGHEGEELRWLVSFKGIDSLLNAFEYPLEIKLELLERLKANFAQEFGMSRFLKKQLDSKYRVWRKKIEYILGLKPDAEEEIKPIATLLERREKALSDIAKRLQKLEEKRVIQRPIADLLPSYIHMYMNRLFRSQNRKYEMVIYDFLYRNYQSQYARQKYQKPQTMEQ